MKKIFIVSLIFLLSIQYCFSLDTVSTKYYPLKIGNSWTYYNSSNIGYPNRTKQTVTSTSAMNGHLYYNITYISTGIRVDSVYGRLLQYSPNGCAWLTNETLVDSLSARLHDSSHVSCVITWLGPGVCTDTSIYTIFGLQRQSKRFTYYGFESLGYRRYVKGLGMESYYMSNGINYNSSTLIGCVINGVVYGDTSLTGINKISNEVPEKFLLYQNYPNPFNPTTKIRFDIRPPLSGEQETPVSLKIYDILGKEVAILVNEQLKPGSYEVEWNGTNYSSGVYWYRLISGDPLTSRGQVYIETRKLVLLK